MSASVCPMPDGDLLELFPDLDLGTPDADGSGCAAPIGRRRMPRPRPYHPRRRVTTAQLLGELRALFTDELGGVRLSLQQIERHARCSAARQADAAEQLDLMRQRLVALERAVSVVEKPMAPHPTRRNPCP
jgi:hypothetical protein